VPLEAQEPLGTKVPPLTKLNFGKLPLEAQEPLGTKVPPLTKLWCEWVPLEAKEPLGTYELVLVPLGIVKVGEAARADTPLRNPAANPNKPRPRRKV
jgi:hypothetical protein